MLFLASFFPMSEMEEDEQEHKFNLVKDFLRATVDLADLVGLYFVSLACLVWVWIRNKGAHNGAGATSVVAMLLSLTCYKPLLLSAATHFLGLGAWAALLQDGIVSLCLGLVALQLYIGVTAGTDS